MYRFALIVLLMASSAIAADINVVENPVPGTSFAEASVKIDAKQSVTWDVTPEPTKIVENGPTIYFNGPAGKYKVTATIFWIEDNAVKTKKYRQDVVIGKAPIPPPVDPPVPNDDFTKAIQTAFDADTTADKAIHVQKLASLYRVASTNTVNDANIKTYGQLFDTMKVASRTLLPETAIPQVRRVVGDRLNKTAGAVASPIDRVKIAAEFKAVADALSQVK